MGAMAIPFCRFVGHAPGGKVGFDPDDWLDSRLAARAIKIDRAVHGAVVGQREGGHAKLFGVVNQLGDAAQAVQQ